MDASFLKPSDAELEILRILWKDQPCTIRFVHDELSKFKQVGYTTTLKQVQRMVEKGLLIKETSGKSHLYSTSIKEKDTKNGLLDRLVETAFEGSAMQLALHALGRAKTSPEELQQLKEWLNQIEGGKK